MSIGRQFWVMIHRWAGLTIALFTFVAGVTGAIIPWQHEIINAFSSDYPEVPVRHGVRPLSWPQLAKIAEKRSGGVTSDLLPLRFVDGEPAILSVEARPGAKPLGFDEIILDPYDGHEIARRSYDASVPAQVLATIYQLHYTLLLGEWGTLAFGIAALIWTVDCFVGFYLTFPVKRTRWTSQWKKSWSVRWRASGYKLNFDLHRAGGLWLWPMLFVFAWSSVAMNLFTVYEPIMATLTDYEPDAVTLPEVRTPARRLDWEDALDQSRKAVSSELAKRDIRLIWEREIRFLRPSNTYLYIARTDRDKSDNNGNSYFYLKPGSWKIVHISLPTGETNGNTFSYWIGQLHVAGVFGLPYRIFVSFFGLAVAVITVTGAVIWMRKRSARLLSKQHRSEKLQIA